MNINKNKNKGITLIEVLAVVIISVLLTVGAFTLYDRSSSKNKEKDLISGIHHIQMSIKSSINNNDYSIVNNNYAISVNAIPKSMAIEREKILHPFGGELFFLGNSEGFIVGLDGLTEKQCISISSKNNISDYVFIGENTSGPSLNPTVAEAIEECQKSRPLVGFIYTGNITKMMSSPFEGGPVGGGGGEGEVEVDPNLPCGSGGLC